MIAQMGRHVLIADDNSNRRGALDTIVRHHGCRVTLAMNGDETMAVLRPSLHPLVVMIHANMRYPDDGDRGSLLLALLANQDFADTHAFIVTVSSLSDDELSALQASASAQAPSAHMQWLPLAGTIGDVGAALAAAGRYLRLKASGGTPTP